MKNMIKLTRQTGDSIFVNLDSVAFITSKVEMGVELTEVGFAGADNRSVLVKEGLSEVEENLAKYEN